MRARDWVDRGTTLFLTTLERLDDDEIAGATSLPGWTRGHLVAHVHQNALALQRLTSWAATGVENAMYESRARRDLDIEQGSSLPPAELRRLVRASAADLEHDLDQLSAEQWDAEVRTAQGTAMPATVIPWLRARDLLVHSVDLDAGTTFDDLPADFTAALVTEVVGTRAGRGEGPAIAAWLTGRGDPPTLDPWL